MLQRHLCLACLHSYLHRGELLTQIEIVNNAIKRLLQTDLLQPKIVIQFQYLFWYYGRIFFSMQHSDGLELLMSIQKQQNQCYSFLSSHGATYIQQICTKLVYLHAILQELSVNIVKCKACFLITCVAFEHCMSQFDMLFSLLKPGFFLYVLIQEYKPYPIH